MTMGIKQALIHKRDLMKKAREPSQAIGTGYRAFVTLSFQKKLVSIAIGKPTKKT